MGEIGPRDGTIRWAKWKARFERDAEGKLPQGSSELTAQIVKEPAIQARIMASFDNLHKVETSVRQILNGAGVPTILYIYYFDFGRELWKLQDRGITGEAAKKEGAILRDKWAARGLSPELMNKISYDVFSLTLPPVV